MKITEDTFYRILCDFYSFMGREKLPVKGRTNLVYNEINGYNNVEIVKAFKSMRDNLDSLPQNIAKTIKKTIYENRLQDPNHKTNEPFRPHKFGRCNDCNGCGVFKLRIKKDGSIYEPIKYCAACNNYKQWVNDPGQRIFKHELERLGIQHKPYTVAVNSKYFKNIINDKYNPVTADEDLKKLANNSTKTIGD